MNTILEYSPSMVPGNVNYSANVLGTGSIGTLKIGTWVNTNNHPIIDLFIDIGKFIRLNTKTGQLTSNTKISYDDAQKIIFEYYRQCVDAIQEQLYVY